jgi:hypothetical protein
MQRLLQVHLTGGCRIYEWNQDKERRWLRVAEENKKRIPLWLYPETIKKTDELFPKDNCKSRSEFIEKAIHFYSGYITSGENNKYLPPFPVLLKALRTVLHGCFSSWRWRCP